MQTVLWFCFLTNKQNLWILEQEHEACNESAEKDITDMLYGAAVSRQGCKVANVDCTEPMASTSATLTTAEQLMSVANANQLSDVTCADLTVRFSTY